MKKRSKKDCFWQMKFVGIRCLKKFLFVFSLLIVVTQVHAQQGKISISLRNVSLEKVFQEVRRQSEYRFVYGSEEIKNVVLPVVNLNNVSIGEVMDFCLRGTDWVYLLENNVVIVRKRTTQDRRETVVQLKGFIYDLNRIPLPGVTVKVVGLPLGTATDTKGWFLIELPVAKGQLEFSFVGFQNQVVNFTEKTTKDTLRIILKEDVKTIEEVVVTGYGNIKRTNYTGASTTVKASDVMMPGVSSIDQMLQGVVPGMLVWNKTGQVGATSKIRVRGTSTLLGNQEPLWVVDGVIQRDPQPFNSDENTKFSVDADDIKELAGNAISWLNPNDIETITVLKDASATAIYGSKAANGVIVVTTKKASIGKISVNYSGDFSIGQRPRYGLYDLMNSAELMQFQREIYEERRIYPVSSIVLPEGYYGLVQKLTNLEISLKDMNREYEQMARRNTDWFDILFRNSFNHSHSLSFSGGSEKVQNRTSFGFSEENGEAKGNGLTSFTASSNTTISLFERLRINIALNGTIREVEGFAYGVDPFTYAYTTSRAIPAYNEDGSLYYHEKQGESSYAISGKSTYNYNILNELANTGSKNTTRTWGTTLDLQLDILPGLQYQGLLSYSSSSSNMKRYASERSFYITSIRGYEYGSVGANSLERRSTRLPVGGLLETDLTNVSTISVRNSLVYDRLFNEKHRMTLQVGMETNSVKTKGESNARYGYLPDRGETFATPPTTFLYNGGKYEQQNSTEYVSGTHTIVDRIENELSEFATAVYVYDNRYVLNLSARIDASNRFGQDKNKRFQPTWSAGVKWRVANEPFWNNSWWFNNLDLSASYGYQGNAVTTVSPDLIAIESYFYQYEDYGLKIKSLPYPNLGWEKTKTWNLGVDASFLDGRLNFTFNYFKKNSDVLSSKSIAYENGMANGVVSGSTMENNGYDFVINVIPVRTNNFTWQLSLNTSVTNNRVTKNDRVNTQNDYLNGSCVVDGRPFSTFYSYEFAGLNQENGLPQFNKMDIEDAETPRDFLVESGKFTPDFTGGLNTMFKFKQFSLYALFAIQWGGYDRLPDLYSATGVPGAGLPLPMENVSKKLINRWKKPGDNTLIPSLPGIDSRSQSNSIEYVAIPATKISSYSSKENCYKMYNLSDARVANTDFIRCRSLSLAYNFTGDWLEKTGLAFLQLKASMTNPFMWVADKKWDGLDPETGNWPTRRVTSLSVQVVF